MTHPRSACGASPSRGASLDTKGPVDLSCLASGRALGPGAAGKAREWTVPSLSKGGSTASARTSRGITLIESMVALTIMALLIVLGLPSFQSWLQNTQIRNAAESISAGIQRARMEAIRRNQNVRFTLVSLTDAKTMDDSCAASANGASWVISLDDPASSCSAAASDTTAPRIVDKRAAGDGGLSASVSAVAGDGTTAASAVIFNGFGRVSNASPIARVNVTSTASGSYRSLRVEVNEGGAVRVCDPGVSDTADPRKCS
ncbi:GspH/FimT family pseudopilin [Caldimonas sp. KR1-144]|uniref:GspH/FimT family pseudopilin n=1 Tax=Caldimonas sp. KR1-144 TaxID=3400911 RepID=UPI003C01BFFD